MTGAELVYSPGYGMPAYLGRAQLRLWRYLDRTIGGHTHRSTTVRTIATELGENAGTVSRDLDALARLGLAVHAASWGKRGVLVWRVVSAGGRRGWDAARRRRALARMGLRSPGQLALAIADPEPVPVPRAPDHPPAGSPLPPPVGEPAPEVYAAERCSCGRTRIVRVGVEPSPCPHPPDRRTVFEP